MNKYIIAIFILALANSCSNNDQKRIKGAEIWEKYLATIGDHDKIKNLKSISFNIIEKR